MFQKKVHIWHDSRKELVFMYKPLVQTIIIILKELYSISDIDYSVSNDFNSIQSESVFIWVGVNIPDFSLLKERNIYTIFCNTEPNSNSENSDEIWTYSKYLYYNYIPKIKDQIIKFIPIMMEEKVPFVNYTLPSKDLIFIGNFTDRTIKYNKFPEDLKKIIIQVYHIWNDNDYQSLIKNKPAIYLNFTKDFTYALPSIRINKLLSHKCIIISEFTNKIDDELYKDMVYFCKLDEIEVVYRNLINRSVDELHEISNKIYDKFYEKFHYKNAIKLILQKK